MNRKQIESITASVAVILITFGTLGSLLFSGDQFFNWDLFTPLQEKRIGFALVSTIGIVVATTLINIIMNLSMIADNLTTGMHE